MSCPFPDAGADNATIIQGCTMDTYEADVARRRVLSPILDAGEYRTLSSSVRLELGATSRAGKLRPFNQDHYLAVRLGRSQEVLDTSLAERDVPGRFEEYAYALLVADGLGQTGAGSLASRIALSTFAHLALHYGRWNVRIDRETAFDVMNRAQRLYEGVNDAVIRHAQDHEELEGMATTLTAAYSAGDDLFIAHVGHSRAYLYRQGELTKLTVDHTVAESVARNHVPQPLQPASSQDLRHILTDTIGGRRRLPEINIEHFRLQDGDRLLICTNGLTDVVDDKGIAEVLACRRHPSEDCRILGDLALEHGSEDDTTIVLGDYRIPRI